jgi:hypothetical protein
MKSSWFHLAVLVAASSSALAQTAAQTGAAWQVRKPDLVAALESWRAENGAGWQLSADTGTGFLEMLYGASVAAPNAPASDADWFTLARGELAATENMHGLQAQTLVEDRVLFLPLDQVGCGDKMTVRFRQQVAGVPVEGGFANVLFDKHGALLSIQVTGQPRIAAFGVTPALTANTAGEFALARFNSDFGVAPTSVETPRLVVAQIENGELRMPVLAWRETILSEPASGAAVGRTYWIDARTGSVAKSQDAIENFDVGGTVYTMATADHYPDEAGHPTSQQPMKYARLTSSAGTVTTDANGNFNYPGVSGPLSITCAYVGTFNQVNNSAGSPYSLVFNGATGSNNIVLNSAPTALVTAQSNVFQAVNTQRDFIRSINPLDATSDFIHTANANIASTCNAFYNGSSINFYQAGGGCANTGYANIVYHENGHWLNQQYGTGNGGDGMGEGNADVWAMYIDDDPIVGHDFCGSGCNVRTGLNTRQFCGDANPACYGEVHNDGEVWMGAAWKVRRNLKTALGVGPGGAIANNLFLGWMNGYNQGQIKSVIETQWLTLDDNDANISNGTPHYAQIDPAFREQGFPGYTLQLLQYSGVTQLPDTTDTTGPYVVDATIVALNTPPVVNPVLHYKVGNAAYVDVSMGNIGGNVFRGSIPGQASPVSVGYYLSASDSAANNLNYPAAAPTTTLRFDIGTKTVVLNDNFNTNLGWTVANTALTTGAWERGDPVGTSAQPEDDNPLGTGTFCYFTQQGTVGGAVGTNDVDGGPTVLTSPVLSMAAPLATISYAYWQYDSTGEDSLVVQLSNGGGWVTARTYVGGQGTWKYDTLDVGTYVTPNSTVQIRFSTADNPNNSIEEAAIDDVVASTLGASGCPMASTYCTPKINSQFCVPLIASSGTASASSANPFNITASQLINNKTVILFYGYGQSSAPFQGGVLCVNTPLMRTPISNTGGNVGPDDCTGVAGYNFNARIQSGIDPLLVSGAVVYAQFYYRDPMDPQTVGLTNAVQFQICP